MRNILIALFLSTACQAQDIKGPQQYISTDAIPGLITHWDLNDAGVITESGGLLVDLQDKGIGNNDVTPASAGVRPSYFSTGGPNNRGYVEMLSGKTFQNITLSLTTSPLIIYAVVKLPSLATSNGQAILSFGNTGGTDQIEFNTASGGFFRMYTGISPFFSASHTLPNRTDWMLLKMVIQDANSFWLEVNNEPPGPLQDSRNGVPLTVINRIAFLFPGIKIADVRLYNRMLSFVEDQGLRNYYVSTFALSSPTKLIVLLGDSHTQGIMSGTATLGPYAARMIAANQGTIINHGKISTVVDPGTYGQGFDNAELVYNNLKERTPVYNPSRFNNTYIVFQYGTNDSAIRGTGAPGAPNRSEWNTLYRGYIQSFINAGFPTSHLFICTPPYSTGTYVSTTLSQFRDDIITIADDLDIGLINIYDEMVTATLDCNTTPDHIHGDDTIHTLIYNLHVTALGL